MIRGGQDIEYCGESQNIQYCFGCFGIRNKKFCILNKQYGEEEYWLLVDDIKSKMMLDGEYGEFVPMAASPLPYNDSNAQQEYPLTKDAVFARGLNWREEKDTGVDLTKLDVLRVHDLPDDSADAPEDILKKVIVCEETGRPFRLTEYELSFYKKRKLPLPRVHPDVLIYALLMQRHPYRLWDDVCKKCAKVMKSAYDPSRNFTVYCEDCYQKEVV